MLYENLMDYISSLEETGELIRIDAEVDPVFELSEIVHRLNSSSNNPAVLFENITGSTLPVMTNLYGSESRICRALGISHLDELGTLLTEKLNTEVPEGLFESIKQIPQRTQLGKLLPKSVRNGICQQIVKLGRDVNLREFPMIQGWPSETNASVTAGHVITRGPESSIYHLENIPLEVRDPQSFLIHWGPHDKGYADYLEYQKREQQMPVAVSLGGDATLTLLSQAALPANIDSWHISGLVRNQSLSLVNCRSLDLTVPADSEMIIEGMIDTKEPLEKSGSLAGPFGYATESTDCPILQVTAVTHRSNPVFPARIPSWTSTENYWISKAVERLILPFVQFLLPEVSNLHQPLTGADSSILFVSIKKQYPHQAGKVIQMLWSLPQFQSKKMVIVVDDGIQLQNEKEVWWQVGSNVHPERDTFFSNGPGHQHDHASPQRAAGVKMGIDATTKLPAEGHPRPWPEKLESNEATRNKVKRRWIEYGLNMSLLDENED